MHIQPGSVWENRGVLTNYQQHGLLVTVSRQVHVSAKYQSALLLCISKKNDFSIQDGMKIWHLGNAVINAAKEVFTLSMILNSH